MKGLYIHIPFCVKKCEYCDFLSFSDKTAYFEKYTEALLGELSRYEGTEIDTVFIGGGTPSVLSHTLIEKICNGVRANFKLSADVEWTMEINPGTITDEKIQAMLEGGINRVSVGVQSFNDRELRAIGRIHSSRTAYDTVNTLYKSGFNNISIDLMESLPYQTAETFKETLKTAITLPLSHISVYSLIIEEGTPIKEKYDCGVYALPDDDNDREMYRYTGEFLAEYGFCRYEISNYAKDGFESRHNLKYWNCDEYIGVGLGAHSYVDGVRSHNTSELDVYLNGITCVNRDILTETDKQGEFMMLGLRKTEGISREKFRKRFGKYPEAVWGDTITKFTSMGLMENDGAFCRLTRRGLDVANPIMCEFL